MLDNLANVDLSGVQTAISYSYSNQGEQICAILVGIAVMMLVLILTAIVHRAVVGSKSQRHKEFLTDMWVSGRIKQLAKEDNISLEDEEKDFLTKEKRAKLLGKSLLGTVEGEMKEKVAKLEQQAKPKK